jgi:23S rRNA (adenine2503-C2)-methyltransferase
MDLSRVKIILEGQPSYRVKQIYQAVYANLIDDWDQATNLSKEMREILKKEVPLKINAEIFPSTDKRTFKALFHLADVHKTESVLMRHGDGRNTVCVSCQVGCPMGCDFCATGKMGFKRNLTVDEIVDQVLFFARYLKKYDERVSNVVFMGMGEPMLNYEAVMKTIKILNDKEGLNIGIRKISISTCGVVHGIDKLALEPYQVNLAISLHAPNDIIRSRIMPVNKQYSTEKVLKAVSNYIKKTNRKVMIEYLLLDGINDSPKDAKELARLLKDKLGRLFVVNVISYNTTGKRYRKALPKTTVEFKSVLEKEGIDVTQRYRFGHDVDAACGQLVTKAD